MAQLTRRGFVKVTGAAAAAPVVAGLSSAASAQDQPELRVDRDIVFAKGGDMDMTLDVYHPAAGVEPKRMAIIHLFGGGFFGGSKEAGYIVNDIQPLAKNGYTNISANYRLSSEGSWPAQINDVKAAIRWTRANADDIGIDADKIAVAGYSAGGMLALLAGGTNGMAEFEGDGGNAGVSSDVAAVIGVYPLASAEIATSLWPEGEATPEAIRAASPITYIGENHAPTILIQGTADTTVLPSSSINYWNGLHEAGVPAALTMIQGADHAFDGSALDAVEVMANSIDLFLDRLIVNPEPYPGFGFGGGGPGRGGPGRGGPGGPGRGGPGGE